MAVTLNPRADRLLARLPRLNIYSALELLLLVLIAVQCARLFWTSLTPLGPVGEWVALGEIRPVAVAAPSLGSYDPFFRGGQPAAAPAQVTVLDIRLYGVMGNQATGGGTAIIGTAGGAQQRSFAVGDEIMPGVTLTAIGFDNVTITRNGAPEQLYMDQTPAGVGAGGATPGAYTAPPPYTPPAYTPPPQPVPVTTVAVPPPPPPQAMTPSPRR
jgi:general secretion pathway protein C